MDAATTTSKQKLKSLINNQGCLNFEEVGEIVIVCILLTLRKYLFMLYSYGGFDPETKTYPSEKPLNKFLEM